MTMSSPAVLIVVDFLVVILLSALIGATAPRWPDRWLDRDRFPLTLCRLDKPSRYRAAGVGWMKDSLPELGSLFGGESKKQLPGYTEGHLRIYLRECRRAEWVHWLSMLTWIPLLLFNPPRMVLFIALLVIFGNLPFVLIVRYNRIRIMRMLKELPPTR